MGQIENFIFVDYFVVKVDGSDVIPGMCVIVKTHSYGNIRYYSMKMNRNCRQDIFSGVSKDYKYVKSPHSMHIGILTITDLRKKTVVPINLACIHW